MLDAYAKPADALAALYDNSEAELGGEDEEHAGGSVALARDNMAACRGGYIQPKPASWHAASNVVNASSFSPGGQRSPMYDLTWDALVQQRVF